MLLTAILIRISCFVVIAGILPRVASLCLPDEGHEESVRVIESLPYQWAQLYDNGRYDMVEYTYTEDAAVLYPDEDDVVGRKDIGQFYKSYNKGNVTDNCTAAISLNRSKATLMLRFTQGGFAYRNVIVYEKPENANNSEWKILFDVANKYAIN